MAGIDDPRADAKLQNLPREELLALWAMRHPEDGGKKLKFSAILAEVPLRYGFTVSLSTLSEFYKWLSVWKRWQDSKSFAGQARAELAAKDPSLSDEELDRFADRVMKTEAAVNKDAKSYVALRRLGIAEKKEALNRDRLTAATKSDVEKGLDALAAEIQGNAPAMALYQKLREVLQKA
jgi:hypothetical protein